MSAPVLVLRPRPGAARTAARLDHLGLVPILYPLFAVEAVDWTPPPPDGFDCLLLTSANAARLGGAGLAGLRHLPLYAVGRATARAAVKAGFADVRIGGGDAASTVARIQACGHASLLHLSGVEYRPFDAGALRVARLCVYRTVPTGDAAGLAAAVPPDGPVAALVHSPRAGERLAQLAGALRGRIAVAAISAAAVDACGSGWRQTGVADRPDEDALLARLLALV